MTSEEEELDEGDVLSCDECGASLKVASVTPLELESDKDEEDEDEDRGDEVDRSEDRAWHGDDRSEDRDAHGAPPAR